MYNSVYHSLNQISPEMLDLAQDYIDEAVASSGHSTDEYLESMRNMFRRDASHLGDCFTDTDCWVTADTYGDEDKLFARQEEFQAAVVLTIMDGQDWTYVHNPDDEEYWIENEDRGVKS